MSKKIPTCEHCKKKKVRVIRFANEPNKISIGRLCDKCITVVCKNDEYSFLEKMHLLMFRDLP